MRVLFIQEYSAKTSKGDIRTVAAGAVLDLSTDKAGRLIEQGVVTDFEPILAAWRGFVVSAAELYEDVPKTADAWSQHMKQVHAAEALFARGCIAEARRRLENALVALRGVPLVQPDLAT
ncbi:MAG: hypothetical protein AB7I29_13685 [Geobacter sp.]